MDQWARKATLLTTAILAGCLSLTFVHSGSAAAVQNSSQASNGQATAHPARNSSAKAEFAGQFNLPYEVECAGMKFAAGQYMIAVDRQGKSQNVIFTRAGQNVRLPAKAAFPSSRRGSGSAIIVRRSGLERKLEAVYVESLRLVLYLDSEPFLQVSGTDPQIERLPIS